jgi:hypothetical protein
MDRPAHDGVMMAKITTLLNFQQIAKAIVGKLVKVKHFQTQLNLVNDAAFLRQLLNRTPVGGVESHVQPGYFMIKRDSICLVVDYFQTFFAEIRPAVVIAKVLEKQTTVERARPAGSGGVVVGSINLLRYPYFDVRIMLTVDEDA